MGLTRRNWPALEAYIAKRAGAGCRVTALDRLSGGAIQENYHLKLTMAGGEWRGEHDLVLRRDSPSSVPVSLSRAREYALLKTVCGAGVKAPRPCLLCEDESVIGGPFFIMRFAKGETAGHKLAKAPPSDALVRDIGANLARLHALTPPIDVLDFLPVPEAPAAKARIADYRGFLDALPGVHPAVEWGLTWCERHSPPDGALVLCHRDYRTGNLVIDGEELVTALDWEFAGFSSPLEDIGWFLAKCWRFGRNGQEAGGLGARDAFYAGYEEASGCVIDRKAVYFWEVMAHIRWAVIALQQARRHVSGEEENIEMALTAHVAPTLEYEILSMTGPE